MMRKSVLLFLAEALICGSTAVTAKVVPPPTLKGETFSTTPVHRLASHCDVSGGNSWFVYESIGIATGPYAGPVTEIGYVEIGPQSYNGFALTPGPVVRWDASFTISSPAGRVVGLKTLSSGTHYTGLCLDPVEYAAYTTVHYEAVIHPKVVDPGRGDEDREHQNLDTDSAGETSEYADQGDAYSQVFVPYPASPPTSLYENFTSSQSSTTVIESYSQVSFTFTSTSTNISNSTWAGTGSFSFVGTPTGVSLAQLRSFNLTDVADDSGVTATFNYGLTDLNSFSAKFDASGALTALSLGTNVVNASSVVNCPTACAFAPQSFDVASLAAGGATAQIGIPSGGIVVAGGNIGNVQVALVP